jgi:hypothetical protein
MGYERIQICHCSLGNHAPVYCLLTNRSMLHYGTGARSCVAQRRRDPVAWNPSGGGRGGSVRPPPAFPRKRARFQRWRPAARGGLLRAGAVCMKQRESCGRCVAATAPPPAAALPSRVAFQPSRVGCRCGHACQASREVHQRRPI